MTARKAQDSRKPTRDLPGLLELMERLRDPRHGCPWDREQSFASIAPYTIEEAYEVADAIDRREWPELRDELGDLLFQIVFYAQLGREAELFNFQDIVAGIVAKMTRRHPHVFGDGQVSDVEAQSVAWELHKAGERTARGNAQGGSALDGVARTLPPLGRAAKLQKRAAHVGFDWPKLSGVLAKVHEELAELQEELEADAPAQRVEAEVGDLLFACVNLSRHLGVDPDGALRGANTRFERRFRAMESTLAESGRSCRETSLGEMDQLWEDVKRLQP
jgi:ATP diphosphatase